MDIETSRGKVQDKDMSSRFLKAWASGAVDRSGKKGARRERLPFRKLFATPTEETHVLP